MGEPKNEWDAYWFSSTEVGVASSPRTETNNLVNEPPSDSCLTFLCNRKKHPQFLMDEVYATACKDQSLRVNSGVEGILLRSGTCFCSLEVVSFRDFLLGDRGVRGILPLFKAGRRVRSLSLAGNAIHDKGLKAVAAALCEPGVLLLLSVLDLSGNHFTSSSVAELELLLKKRSSIIMLGLVQSMLSNERRQRLLRKALDNFEAADPNDMCKAWELASPGTGFMDSAHWVQCAAIVEMECSREQLAHCRMVVAKYAQFLGRDSADHGARNGGVEANAEADERGDASLPCMSGLSSRRPSTASSSTNTRGGNSPIEMARSARPPFARVEEGPESSAASRVPPGRF